MEEEDATTGKFPEDVLLGPPKILTSTMSPQNPGAIEPHNFIDEPQGSLQDGIDVDMEAENVRFLYESDLRKKEDDHAMRKTGENVNKYVRCSQSHVAMLLKPIVDQLEAKEITIHSRELLLMETNKENDILKKEIAYLQVQSGVSLPLAQPHQRDQNDDQYETISRQQAMVSLLEEKGIDSVDELQNSLGEIEELRSKMQRQTMLLQQANVTTDKELQVLRKQVYSLKGDLHTAKLTVADLREQKDDLMSKLQFLDGNMHSNSFSRIGRVERNDAMKQFPLQTSENHCRYGSSPTHTSRDQKIEKSGKNFESWEFGREAARARDESFGPIERKKEEEYGFSDNRNRTMGYYHEEGDWDMGEKGKPVYSEMQAFRDMIAQQNLPEPPEFNGQNKVSVEGFSKAFTLKYGGYKEKDQIVILETKFLAGKAQKIFRALPDRMKLSVRGILTEIASRLRIAPEDEFRRAKIKWESLRKKPEQSYEDFCLEIDEVAKNACGRASADEISSFKTTKLMGAITDDTLYTLVDTKLGEVDERFHYEVCRSWVTRFEIGQREKRERMKGTGSGNIGDKKKLSQSHNSGNASGFPSSQMVTMNNHSNAPQGTRFSQNRMGGPSGNQSQGDNAGFQGAMNPNWRTRNPNEPTTQKPINFPRCSECKAQGCHEPTCSKAPEARRKEWQQNVTCFRCNEKGHYSSQCTAVMEKQKDNSPTTSENSGVGTVAEYKSLSAPIKGKNEGTEEKTSIIIEKGRIGCTEVELMLDSGAGISLIPMKIWETIKKENGAEWVKNVKRESSKLSQAYTANNEPIKLLSCVILETAMQARTRDIRYYIAEMERENIILGIDHFGKMGIKMGFEVKPREIRVCKDLRITPSAARMIDIQIEGVVREEESYCLISPINKCLSAAVCKVGKDGKAVVECSNFGSEAIILKKGEVIATGELNGFEIIQGEEATRKVIKEYINSLEPPTEVESLEINNMNVGVDEKRWETICEHLSMSVEINGNEREVWKVIQDFQNVFAIDDNELGRTNVTQCEIELNEGTEPIRQRPRPIPLAVRSEIKRMLDKMLSQKVIRASRSPWSSPVVLVKKKDGSIRMCIDYRRVNKVVKNNAHPLPHIEATLQSLAGKKVFSTFDCLAGYWQVPLVEKSKEITAFAIGSELYEWNVLPFGLVTSPAVFQGTMEAIMGELLGKCAYVYVDDLLVASESLEKHAEDVKAVLQKIQESGLRLRAKKCRIAQKEVEYLGHKITPEGVKTEELKVEKMKKFARPTNPKELQSFLGLVSYYRKFILNFAQIAAPITPLTSAKKAWCWGVEQEAAFQKLLSAVCETPVLMQPDTEAAISGKRPFHIFTDASRKGVGAVLAQEGEDGLQHPIAFTSKALSPAETRYHITDLEALAMMHALRRFKVIVYGTPVIIFTDHKPLIYLLKGSHLADRLLRWSIELLEYNVKIIYVAGKANAVADALSRGGSPPLSAEETQGEEDIEPLNIIGEIKEKSDTETSLETDKWTDLLRKEEGWGEVIRLLEEGVNTGVVKIPGMAKGIQLENYMLIGNSLRNVEREECSRIVVPGKVCAELVQEAHGGQFSGHFGTDKLMRQLSQRFFFPKMRAVIEKIVKSCPKCLCMNDHPKLVAPLKPYETSRPLEMVSCDLIEVGLSTQGNKYLLTIIDLFTKFGQAVPIPDKTAETVLRAFVERWAMGEGRVPEILLSDQGKEFANEHFKKFTELLGIQHVMTKGYNSRANGAIERFNKTIMHIIAKKATAPMEWDDVVPFAIFAYNNIAHCTTGEAPMFLMNARDAKGPLKMPGDDAVGICYADVDEYKHLMVQELGKAHKLAKESAEQEWERNKFLFDQKHKTESRKYPQPGSRVLVEVPAEKLGVRCPKLVNKWKGPYRVISCSENSATVTPVLGKGKEILVIPFDNLRVLPSVMANVPIETVKGRAKARGTHVGSQENESLKKFNINEVSSFRQMWTCKCASPCLFWPHHCTALKTTSPSQLARMVNLMNQDDKWKSTAYAKDVLLLTQNESPLVSSTPTKETFRVLAQCPSLPLVVQQIEGWDRAYAAAIDSLIQEHFGTDLLKPLSLMLVMAGGVQRTEVLSAPVVHYLSSTNHVTEMDTLMKFRKPNIIMMVVPFSSDDEEKNHWCEVLEVVPASVEVIVVPDHMSEYDYDWVDKYFALMKEITRTAGKLHVVYPDERVGDLNRPLYAVSDRSSALQYWTIIVQLLDAINVPISDLKVLVPTPNKEDEEYDGSSNSNRASTSRSRVHAVTFVGGLSGKFQDTEERRAIYPSKARKGTRRDNNGPYRHPSKKPGGYQRQ